ncbi:hypothetical protein C0J52_19735 [Blattella germanica]|nr:hypothetical protein C0J52_19735 [Blattella germanica]
MLQESRDTSRGGVEEHVGILGNVESAEVAFIRPEPVLGPTLGSTKQVVISTEIAIGIQFMVENSQRFFDTIRTMNSRSFLQPLNKWTSGCNLWPTMKIYRRRNRKEGISQERKKCVSDIVAQILSTPSDKSYNNTSQCGRLCCSLPDPVELLLSCGNYCCPELLPLSAERPAQTAAAAVADMNESAESPCRHLHLPIVDTSAWEPSARFPSSVAEFPEEAEGLRSIVSTGWCEGGGIWEVEEGRTELLLMGFGEWETGKEGDVAVVTCVELDDVVDDAETVAVAAVAVVDGVETVVVLDQSCLHSGGDCEYQPESLLAHHCHCCSQSPLLTSSWVDLPGAALLEGRRVSFQDGPTRLLWKQQFFANVIPEFCIRKPCVFSSVHDHGVPCLIDIVVHAKIGGYTMDQHALATCAMGSHWAGRSKRTNSGWQGLMINTEADIFLLPQFRQQKSERAVNLQKDNTAIFLPSITFHANRNQH